MKTLFSFSLTFFSGIWSWQRRASFVLCLLHWAKILLNENVICLYLLLSTLFSSLFQTSFPLAKHQRDKRGNALSFCAQSLCGRITKGSLGLGKYWGKRNHAGYEACWQLIHRDIVIGVGEKPWFGGSRLRISGLPQRLALYSVAVQSRMS